MKIFVNSQPAEIAPDTTLHAWLLQSEFAGRPCAVAVNSEFVPREARASVVLRERDCIDVVEPIQGG